MGRLGDPGLVVELLTETDQDAAMALARQCDDFNRQRRDLCDAIEAEAAALVEADRGLLAPLLAPCPGPLAPRCDRDRRCTVDGPLPPATALLAGEGEGRLRASVRAPAGFAVDQALQACADHLERFGGHPAAGGFTVKANKVSVFREQLNRIAQEWLDGEERIPCNLMPCRACPPDQLELLA